MNKRHTGAEQAPGITPGALPSPVQGLFAAIAEALTVPLPSIEPADESAYYKLLEQRATAVQIHLETMLDFPDVDITRDASELRARTALLPITYALYDDPACGRCRKPFVPDDTRHDGRARYDVTSFCRGCVDRCHESTDAFHTCPICEPGARGGEGQ